ncbi:MAG: PadR family transcriptional regulator [Aigarchaeota archaeon]|nr:PadR family transcriptional regulator [Aigarchaeota archaeon]MDW8021133.1 PadR family transcriptional regulator [Nitrososphaerota archaeon]
MGAAYRRLMRKLTIENLWLYVVSLLKEGPLYGYEIREKIEKNFGFKPGKVTCYMVLYKLESEGLISSKYPQKKTESLGPQRKYYVLTAKGEKALEQAKSFLRKLVHEL